MDQWTSGPVTLTSVQRSPCSPSTGRQLCSDRRGAQTCDPVLPLTNMENKFQIKSELGKYRDHLLHHRGPSWPRWILISSGVILVSVVIVCLLTLVSNNPLDASRTISESSQRGILIQRLQSATVPSVSRRKKLSQEDIFISVKTSAKFHSSRLKAGLNHLLKDVQILF